MDEPLTEELLNELLESSSVDRYVDEHAGDPRKLADYLNQMLEAHHLERKDVVREAGIGATYGHYIFSGERNPTRNKVLPLAFAMGLSLRETDRMLQAAGASRLYCKNRRDAIIIFCIEHGYSLMKTNEELFRFGEESKIGRAHV